MKSIKIKIGYQEQAGKSVLLLSNGKIVCGNFVYNGRFLKKFKNYYVLILEYADTQPKNGILDISTVSFWDATSIYDKYMLPKWRRSITVEKIQKFANETEIRKIIEEIKPEFQHSAAAKWKRIFKKSVPNDSNTPKYAWQIF